MYGKSIKDMKKFIVSFCGLLCCVWPGRLSARGMAFVLQAGRAAGVELSPSEKPVVHTALSILQRDVRAVLGDSLRILPAGGDIVAGTVGEGLTLMPWRGGNRLSFCRYSPTGGCLWPEATATARHTA